MDSQETTKLWHRAAKKLKAAWAKLLAKLFPAPVETNPPEANPARMGAVVDAHSTARDA